MKPYFVIFAGDPTRVGVVQGSWCELVSLPMRSEAELPDDAQCAQATAAMLSSRGYDGGGVMLAVPSEWCLCATIPIEDLPKRNRRQLMVYRLEEHLPMAAEELVIDFAVPGNSRLDQVMGVAIAQSRISPLLEALKAAGIWVQSISPTALLATQAIQSEWVEQKALGTDVLLLCDRAAIEMLAFTGEGGQVIEWSTLSDLEAARIELRRLALLRSTPLSVATCGLDLGAAKILAGTGEIQVKSVPHTTPDGGATDTQQELFVLAALRVSAGILAGHQTALIELRRDALAESEPLRRFRTPLSWAVAAAILFCLCLAGALLLWAQAYGTQTRQAQEAERRVYQEAMGKPPVGPNVKARLVSEDRRLGALSGTLSGETTDPAGSNGKTSTLPRSYSALFMLDDTLKSLPRNLRYRLLDLRFSADGLELGGQCRTHGDADAIAVGLRSVGGYTVDPPHSESRGQDKGVSFTINARAIRVPEPIGTQP